MIDPYGRPSGPHSGKLGLTALVRKSIVRIVNSKMDGREIPMSDAINVGEVVDASRVGGLQVRAFGLAVAAALVDGYDTQVVRKAVSRFSAVPGIAVASLSSGSTRISASRGYEGSSEIQRNQIATSLLH
jgi:hypothetical protein